MSFSFKIFFLKISLKILLIFLHLFYQSGLIFGCVLYRKDINPVLKYPICVKTYEKYIFKKCFVLKHGLVSPIYIYKYYDIIFSHNKRRFQKQYMY